MRRSVERRRICGVDSESSRAGTASGDSRRLPGVAAVGALVDAVALVAGSAEAPVNHRGVLGVEDYLIEGDLESRAEGGEGRSSVAAAQDFPAARAAGVRDADLQRGIGGVDPQSAGRGGGGRLPG